MQPGTKSASAFLGSLRPGEIEAFLQDLSPNAMMALPWLFEHWAHPHQVTPAGDQWKTWVILGGRGAGKTRAGSEWVRTMVEGGLPDAPGAASRVALVAETYDQARDVMVLRRERDPCVFATGPEAGVDCHEAPVGVAERGRRADIFGKRPRSASGAAVRRGLGR